MKIYEGGKCIMNIHAQYLEFTMKRLETMIYNVENTTVSKNEILNSLKRLVNEYEDARGNNKKYKNV
jgi:hypothetical protein